ncbi:MAG: hypothetical protein WBG92_03415 [Thiohalocapsa sp.]
MKSNAAGRKVDVRSVPDKIVEENAPTCQDKKGFFDMDTKKWDDRPPFPEYLLVGVGADGPELTAWN